MSQKKIQTEEPDEHWSFLDFKDKVVLDLGCGKFYSSISTAQWFLNKGALKVIGVDLSKENIDNDRFISYAKAIRSTKDLEYFLKYEPEVIKCDIEGAEIFPLCLLSSKSLLSITVLLQRRFAKNLSLDGVLKT